MHFYNVYFYIFFYVLLYLLIYTVKSVVLEKAASIKIFYTRRNCFYIYIKSIPLNCAGMKLKGQCHEIFYTPILNDSDPPRTFIHVQKDFRNIASISRRHLLV